MLEQPVARDNIKENFLTTMRSAKGIVSRPRLHSLKFTSRWIMDHGIAIGHFLSKRDLLIC